MDLKCRACKGTDLVQFLDLGSQPHSDRFLTKAAAQRPEPRYPLNVQSCQECGLVQLGHVVPADVLYDDLYVYENSTTRTFQEHFRALAATVIERFRLLPQDLAVDIGSNVGLLLSGFRERGPRVVGVEPAPALARTSKSKGIPTFQQFFSHAVAAAIVQEHGQAKAVTATNVFGHVDDWDEFVAGSRTLLRKDGILVIEVPWLLRLLHGLLYDTIYHQHLSYVSVKPLMGFFGRNGMEIVDVQDVETHGGSLRLFVAHAGAFKVAPSVREHVDLEERNRIHELATLRKFAADVEEHRRQLVGLLQELKRQGRRIVGVGAPAKGNTLLNYCGIDTTLLDYVTERAAIKVGRLTPGTRIPIRHDDVLREDQPDYALLLSWNFAQEIMSNLSFFSERGGLFILPFPKPALVGGVEHARNAS